MVFNFTLLKILLFSFHFSNLHFSNLHFPVSAFQFPLSGFHFQASTFRFPLFRFPLSGFHFQVFTFRFPLSGLLFSGFLFSSFHFSGFHFSGFRFSGFCFAIKAEDDLEFNTIYLRKFRNCPITCIYTLQSSAYTPNFRCLCATLFRFICFQIYYNFFLQTIRAALYCED